MPARHPLPCEVFEAWLHDCLDRRLSPTSDPRVVAHASECGACHELLEDFDWLHHSLNLVYEPTPDSPLVDCWANSTSSSIISPGSSTQSIEESDGLSAVAAFAETQVDLGRPAVWHTQNLNWKVLVGTLAASLLAIAAFDRYPLVDPGQVVSRNSPAPSVAAPAVGGPTGETSATGTWLNVPAQLTSDSWGWDRFPQYGPLADPVDWVQAGSRPGTPPELSQNLTVSLATCYELTSGLPGIRPLSTSVNATWSCLQRIFPANSPGENAGVTAERPGSNASGKSGSRENGVSTEKSGKSPVSPPQTLPPSGENATGPDVGLHGSWTVPTLA